MRAILSQYSFPSWLNATSPWSIRSCGVLFAAVMFLNCPESEVKLFSDPEEQTQPSTPPPCIYFNFQAETLCRQIKWESVWREDSEHHAVECSMCVYGFAPWMSAIRTSSDAACCSSMDVICTFACFKNEKKKSFLAWLPNSSQTVMEIVGYSLPCTPTAGLAQGWGG